MDAYTPDVSLAVEGVKACCPAGEACAKQNIAGKKTPVLSSEGTCIRGEIARLGAMLGLALVGIIDAFYDSYSIYSGQLLWCPPPIDGCNTVASSPYAFIFGLPVGYFGVVYYLCMFGLAALLAIAPISRGLRWSVLLGAATGVSFSIYFMYIQITFIHAFCIYCVISALLTLFLLIAAFWHFRATRMDPIPAPA
jgi:uncharacterized membrane protein